MSDRVTITGDVLSLPFCELELARTHDGRVVIQDPNDEEAEQFIMDPEVFADWASQQVDANKEPGRRIYSLMHVRLGVHARLVTTADVKSDWMQGGWCVWHNGQADTRFDFEREEVDALVAFMGSEQFLDFMASAPASVSS